MEWQRAQEAQAQREAGGGAVGGLEDALRCQVQGLQAAGADGRQSPRTRSRRNSLERQDLAPAGAATLGSPRLGPAAAPAGSSDGEADEEVDEVRAKLSLQERERVRAFSSIQRTAISGSASPPGSPVQGASTESLAEIFVADIPVHPESLDASYMTDFQRINISGRDVEHSDEIRTVCRRFRDACALRDKYQFATPSPNWGGIDEARFERAYELQMRNAQERGGPSSFRRRQDPPFVPFPESPEESLWTPRDHKFGPSDYRLEWKDGIMLVQRGPGQHAKSAESDSDYEYLDRPPPVQEFYKDFFQLLGTMHDAACKMVAFKRLKLLESLFDLHMQLNAEKENAVQRSVPHRDFYNIRKVDTHIHHSAIMNQKHLLRFIKSKLKHCPNEVVIQRDGKFLTLSEVFRSLKLTAYDLSIDTLDMHADNTFHRFDRFNLKYNPVGESRLREIFLKSDNFLSGRYLAEITKEVFSDCEANKYVMLEPRISIYGRNANEWSTLAEWYCTNKLASPTVRWMVQIPRLYSVYKGLGLVNNFQDMLGNIFEPLFKVTLDPGSDRQLDTFLNQLTGFDCVDDESKLDRFTSADFPSPENWDLPDNPPYAYWIYYIYANLYTLNTLRKSLGMTTFAFRPHAGEAGDFNNLAATFLCATGINHGILLRKAPALQYLYYLKQIGLAVSPLSNNKLFLDYHSNPFKTFFCRGLNVSLSTDDPLMLHITKDPLLEEYGVAAQVWRLTSTDQCEIARNSVLQSGFEHPYKRHFLGEGYDSESQPRYGNNIVHTNVPDVRIIYRRERLQAEWDFVNQAAA